MLVVIAIIAILAAMLLPALNMAKGYAHMTLCTNNLHEITLATLMYADDNDEMTPSYEAISTDRSNVNADLSLGRLWPYCRDTQVWRCPSDKRDNSDWSFSYPMVGRIAVIEGYECSEWDCLVAQGAGWYLSRPMSSFTNPEMALAYGEENTRPDFYSVIINNVLFNNVDAFGARHLDSKALGVYLDGHVTQHQPLAMPCRLAEYRIRPCP